MKNYLCKNNSFGIISVFIYLLSYQINLSTCISTTHHDKKIGPPSTIFQSQDNTPEEKNEKTNSTKSEEVDDSSSERHRRLIPYSTFYLGYDNAEQFNVLSPNSNSNGRQQYKIVPHKIPIFQIPSYTTYKQPENLKETTKTSYNPFNENNKLPGGFRPMLRPLAFEEITAQQPKSPNYAAIYDKLIQYKQFAPQQQPHQTHLNQPIRIQSNHQLPKYISVYKIRRPTNSFPVASNYDGNQNYKTSSKNIAVNYIPIKARPVAQNYQPLEQPKNYGPIIVTKSQDNFKYKYQPVTPNPIYLHKDVSLTNLLKSLPNNNHAPQTFPPNLDDEEVTPNPLSSIENNIYTPNAPTPNTNTLLHLLKALQYSNYIAPKTPSKSINQNIKPIPNILNAFKYQQPKLKPIIVQPENSNSEGSYEDFQKPEEEIDDDATFSEENNGQEKFQPEFIEPKYKGSALGHSGPLEDDAGTITQVFPARTLDGGTPGNPGIDYPALSEIPQTSFSCKTQRYKGFFGDPETKCQVWHYCDLNGGQASFLCPNGTIFSQVALTCDWWYNVKCANTPQLYVLNERLYKYILPFTPKFPEDYSGPLVDKYLTEKFKEMEEKLQRQKGKGKVTTTTEEPNEGDELQRLESRSIVPVTISTEETTVK